MTLLGVVGIDPMRAVVNGRAQEGLPRPSVATASHASPYFNRLHRFYPAPQALSMRHSTSHLLENLIHLRAFTMMTCRTMLSGLLNTLAVSEYFSHALPRLGATIGHHCDRNFFPTKLSANLKQMLPWAKVRDRSGRE